MSSEDRVRPYHAKRHASGQEAADAVEAVLQHTAEREERAHEKAAVKKQPKWMLPLGINLGVFAVYLLIAPPAWVVVNPLEGPPPEERVENMRLAMYMQAMRVESFRIKSGQLPVVLSDAGSQVAGVDYQVVTPSHYQLVATVGGQTLLYDSNEPADEWVGPVAEKLRR